MFLFDSTDFDLVYLFPESPINLYLSFIFSKQKEIMGQCDTVLLSESLLVIYGDNDNDSVLVTWAPAGYSIVIVTMFWLPKSLLVIYGDNDNDSVLLSEPLLVILLW